MSPFILLALAGLGFFALKGSASAKPVLSPTASADPLKSLPPGMTGAAAAAPDKTKNGRLYSVTVWPIQNSGQYKGHQFAIARLKGSKSWVSYWHRISDKKRTLYRGYAPGTAQQAGVVMSHMMSDWNVSK